MSKTEKALLIIVLVLAIVTAVELTYGKKHNWFPFNRKKGGAPKKKHHFDQVFHNKHRVSYHAVTDDDQNSVLGEGAVTDDDDTDTDTGDVLTPMQQPIIINTGSGDSGGGSDDSGSGGPGGYSGGGGDSGGGGGGYSPYGNYNPSAPISPYNTPPLPGAPPVTPPQTNPTVSPGAVSNPHPNIEPGVNPDNTPGINPGVLPSRSNPIVSAQNSKMVGLGAINTTPSLLAGDNPDSGINDGNGDQGNAPKSIPHRQQPKHYQV